MLAEAPRASRLGWRPSRTRFVRWRLVARRAAWRDLRDRHGVHLSARVQILAYRRRVLRLVATDAADFDEVLGALTGDGWRCTLARAPVRP